MFLIIVPENDTFFNDLLMRITTRNLAQNDKTNDHRGMQKYLSLSFALVLPATALALTIEPAHFYTDVRDNSPELAGINLLTTEGIVQGYGEGKFGPSRLVNRAEFLKMAIGATPDTQKPALQEGQSCFPDVQANDWFAPFVCAAKNADVVKGNPDGLFHPERTVQYDEALKMLTLLFGYDIPEVTDANWGERYKQSAENLKTTLPMQIALSTPLTRGMTARLVGGFLAESEGMLEAYRSAEAGQYLSSSSSSSSVEKSSSNSSSQSSVSSSVASSSASVFSLNNHFLPVGKKSDAIADVTLNSVGEPVYVALAQVKLMQEARSVEFIEVVSETGIVLASLKQRTTTTPSDYKKIYETTSASDTPIVLDGTKPIHLYVRAVIRSSENGGFAEDLLQVFSVNITYHAPASNQTYYGAKQGGFSKNQTAFGNLTNVLRTSPQVDVLKTGSGIIVSSFSVSGSGTTNKTLSLENMTFSLIKSAGVITKNWSVNIGNNSMNIPCSMNIEGNQISCIRLQDSAILQSHQNLAIKIFADVSLDSNLQKENKFLQISLLHSGSPEALGSIEWSDGSGHYRWIEGASPIAVGTEWK